MRKALAIVGIVAVIACGGCRTNNGNTNDSPSKGFDKCLNHADC